MADWRFYGAVGRKRLGRWEQAGVDVVAIEVIDQKGDIMEPQSGNEPGVGGELLTDAKDLGSTAVNRLHSEVDNRKGDAATQVKSVSSAIDNVAQGLDSDAPAWLKSAFTQGAQQVQKFADALEQKDSKQLVGDVSNFARQSPTTFLLACAAAGFAASRVFQAGSKANSPSQPPMVGMDSDAETGTSQFATTSQYSTSQYEGRPSTPVGGEFA